MQAPDTRQFVNSSEWTVVHDGNTQMYILKSKTGHRLNGAYTNRTFAEIALYNYLKSIADKPRTPKEK